MNNELHAIGVIFPRNLNNYEAVEAQINIGTMREKQQQRRKRKNTHNECRNRTERCGTKFTTESIGLNSLVLLSFIRLLWWLFLLLSVFLSSFLPLFAFIIFFKYSLMIHFLHISSPTRRLCLSFSWIYFRKTLMVFASSQVV